MKYIQFRLLFQRLNIRLRRLQQAYDNTNVLLTVTNINKILILNEIDKEYISRTIVEMDHKHIDNLEGIANLQNDFYRDFLKKNKKLHIQMIGTQHVNSIFGINDATAFKSFEVKSVQLSEEDLRNAAEKNVHLIDFYGVFFIVEFVLNDFIQPYSPRIITAVISSLYLQSRFKKIPVLIGKGINSDMPLSDEDRIYFIIFAKKTRPCYTVSQGSFKNSDPLCTLNLLVKTPLLTVVPHY